MKIKIKKQSDINEYLYKTTKKTIQTIRKIFQQSLQEVQWGKIFLWLPFFTAIGVIHYFHILNTKGFIKNISIIGQNHLSKNKSLSQSFLSLNFFDNLNLSNIFSMNSHTFYMLLYIAAILCTALLNFIFSKSTSHISQQHTSFHAISPQFTYIKKALNLTRIMLFGLTFAFIGYESTHVHFSCNNTYMVEYPIVCEFNANVTNVRQIQHEQTNYYANKVLLTNVKIQDINSAEENVKFQKTTQKVQKLQNKNSHKETIENVKNIKKITLITQENLQIGDKIHAKVKIKPIRNSIFSPNSYIHHFFKNISGVATVNHNISNKTNHKNNNRDNKKGNHKDIQYINITNRPIQISYNSNNTSANNSETTAEDKFEKNTHTNTQIDTQTNTENIKKHDSQSNKIDYIQKIRLKIHENFINQLGIIKGGIASAITTGILDNTFSVRSAFNQSGLAHILAISGLHMSILSLIVFFILCRILTFIYPLQSRRIAAILSIFITFLYTVLSGYSVSGLRSFAMSSMVLLGVIFHRKTLSMHSASFVAFLMIIFSPQIIFEPSFLLSFSAVMSLLAYFSNNSFNTNTNINLGSHLDSNYSSKNSNNNNNNEDQKDDQNHDTSNSSTIKQSTIITSTIFAIFKISNIFNILSTLKNIFENITLSISFKIKILLRTSVVSFLSTFPYTLYFFHFASIYSIFANILAVPLTTIFVLPLSIICGILGLFTPDNSSLHIIHTIHIIQFINSFLLHILDISLLFLIQIAKSYSSLPQLNLLFFCITKTNLFFITFGLLMMYFLKTRAKWIGLIIILINLPYFEDIAQIYRKDDKIHIYTHYGKEKWKINEINEVNENTNIINQSNNFHSPHEQKIKQKMKIKQNVIIELKESQLLFYFLKNGKIHKIKKQDIEKNTFIRVKKNKISIHSL